MLIDKCIQVSRWHGLISPLLSPSSSAKPAPAAARVGSRDEEKWHRRDPAPEEQGDSSVSPPPRLVAIPHQPTKDHTCWCLAEERVMSGEMGIAGPHQCHRGTGQRD